MNHILNKSNLSPWRKGGTQDFGSFTIGELVEDLDDLAVGDILLLDIPRFDSHNLCRITRIEEGESRSDIMQVWGSAIFVDPYNTDEPRMYGDREFNIYYFDVSNGDLLFFRTVDNQNSPGMEIMGNARR